MYGFDNMPNFNCDYTHCFGLTLLSIMSPINLTSAWQIT